MLCQEWQMWNQKSVGFSGIFGHCIWFYAFSIFHLSRENSFKFFLRSERSVQIIVPMNTQKMQNMTIQMVIFCYLEIMIYGFLFFLFAVPISRLEVCAVSSSYTLVNDFFLFLPASNDLKTEFSHWNVSSFFIQFFCFVQCHFFDCFCFGLITL